MNILLAGRFREFPLFSVCGNYNMAVFTMVLADYFRFLSKMFFGMKWRIWRPAAIYGIRAGKRL
jgi:hypothetical protein